MTLRPENIRILRVEDGEGSAEQPQYNPYGHSSTRSLEGVQGVDAYPPLDILEDLREYQRLVGDDQHDTAKAQKLRKKLEHEWGPHDPELLLLDVTIRKNETLRKLRTKG